MSDWRQQRAAKLRADADGLDDLATACRYEGIRLSASGSDDAPAVVVDVDKHWPDVAAVHLASTLATLAELLRLQARKDEEESR